VKDRRSSSDIARLPRELLERLTHPFADFPRIEALGCGSALLDQVVAYPDAAEDSGATKESGNPVIDSAKPGILAASVVSAALGLVLLAWATRERGPPPQPSST
jgi:hypothetical protein